MNGLMTDDHPLTLTSVIKRAEHIGAHGEVVSRAPDGQVHRTTDDAVVGRARRLAGALRTLGVQPGDRVATLLWNQPEHLELYFAKWQLPDRIEYIDAIPRTATGKWKKTALRERFGLAAKP
jgi:acyl-CoA synthetase (AMP-forming)/AMP-acid ligase II